MNIIEPKDIDDHLFTYFDNTGKYPTDWEQVAFFFFFLNLEVVYVEGVYGVVNI